MPIDLLVFGPHPDDIEIGLGGSIARHTAGELRPGAVVFATGTPPRVDRWACAI